MCSSDLSWETSFDGLPFPVFRKNDRPESEVLISAGCRALPAMVKTLNTSSNRAFQERVMSRILMILALQTPPDDRLRFHQERESRSTFRADDLELEQKNQMEEFNAWWEARHHEYPRWWRF